MAAAALGIGVLVAVAAVACRLASASLELSESESESTSICARRVARSNERCQHRRGVLGEECRARTAVALAASSAAFRSADSTIFTTRLSRSFCFLFWLHMK